ncbi:MAG: homocysteine S-methyltransferase family protein [Bacteroidetes bacterium]|nr:homocysteine S-methyltransferase family protein [Bacteroidota bacterium]
MKTAQLRQLLRERIVVLDGAMGTMIQRHPLDEQDFRGDRFAGHEKLLKGNNDLLTLTQPQIIADIHRAYFLAGADIVETNTFSSTRVAQADYGLEWAVMDLNVESARLARGVADGLEAGGIGRPLYVAGAIGPTNRTASMSPDVNNPGFRAIGFDALKMAYSEQVQGLIAGGVDILLVETVFDTLNAKAALYAIDEVQAGLGTALPVMVSGTITDASGRTLSGQTAEAFLISVMHMPLLSVGFNCALGARQLLPYLQVLDRQSPFAVSAYPNAGLPNEFGQYDEGPEHMAEQIEEYLKLGLVNVVGGCCGTTPEHIAAIAEKAMQYPPRVLKAAIG